MHEIIPDESLNSLREATWSARAQSSMESGHNAQGRKRGSLHAYAPRPAEPVVSGVSRDSQASLNPGRNFMPVGDNDDNSQMEQRTVGTYLFTLCEFPMLN